LIQQERPPFLLSIHRADVSVNVFSSEPLLKDQCSKGSQNLFTPGYRVLPQPADTEYSLWHYRGEEIRVTHLPEEKRVILYGAADAFTEGEVVPYLAYGLLELAGAERGQATIHGAAVSRGDSCVLPLGKAGAGKTSLALELCLHHGYKLLANDLCVIELREGRLRIVAGTQHFFMRRAVVDELFPHLTNLAPPLVAPQQSRWDVRFSITPSEIGVETDLEPRTIDRAFVLQMIKDHPPLIVDEPPNVWKGLYLYDILARYIRKVTIPTVVRWNPPQMLYNPSYDQEAFHNLRLEIMRILIGDVRLQKLSGQLSQMVKYLG
jgi:hypothetical protein